jgi:hypothetical protein
MHEIEGKYIVINCWNRYFDQVARMILHHYDTEEYANTLFVLGSYIFYDISYFSSAHPNKKIIVYQMEQLFLGKEGHWWDVPQVINRLRLAKKENAEIWEMCDINKAFLAEHGITPDKVVTCKFTPSLEELNHDAEQEIDLFFYGNLNKRRAGILANLSFQLYDRNISTMWIANLDFESQKKYMERSKIILNIHHTQDYNRQEQPRIFYALINKKCVLSEPSQKNYFGGAIIESGDFVDSIGFLLKKDRYKYQGEIGYELFKRMK